MPRASVTVRERSGSQLLERYVTVMFVVPSKNIWLMIVRFSQVLGFRDYMRSLFLH